MHPHLTLLTLVLYFSVDVVQLRTVNYVGNNSKSRPRRASSCVNDANDAMHAAFSRMVNRRDRQLFSHFQPDEQLILEVEPKHDLPLSPVVADCSVEARSAKILPGQPIRERALCPYHHVLNYNPNRLPSSITEVVCDCGSSLPPGASFRCEPLRFALRVLLLDENCGSYVETTQNVTLACISVYKSQLSVAGRVSIDDGKGASVHQ